MGYGYDENPLLILSLSYPKGLIGVYSNSTVGAIPCWSPWAGARSAPTNPFCDFGVVSTRAQSLYTFARAG
jgi:hypothetical protein